MRWGRGASESGGAVIEKRESDRMAFVPDGGPNPLRNPVWLRLGAVLLILILGALYFVFASARSRHGWLERQPPPDNSPTHPAPVVPH